MTPPSDANMRFTGGVVMAREDLWLLTESKIKHRSGAIGGTVVRKRGNKVSGFEIKFPGQIAIEVAPNPAMDKPRVTFFSAEGEYERAGAGLPRVVGLIDGSSDGPKGKGWIRGIKRVGGRVYAVGMSRQAYVRDGEVWQRIDAGILAKPGEIAGLNDVDGFDDHEIYAAGLNGEIWRFDGRTWSAIPSPTNVQLNCVRRYGEHVYLAGSAGVVLRGRGDAFQVIATELPTANLYAVEGFNERIYLASMTSLYRLGDNGVEKVGLKIEPPFTAGSLHAADGILMSVGVNHVFTTSDGNLWTQVFT